MKLKSGGCRSDGVSLGKSSNFWVCVQNPILKWINFGKFSQLSLRRVPLSPQRSTKIHLLNPDSTEKIFNTYEPDLRSEMYLMEGLCDGKQSERMLIQTRWSVARAFPPVTTPIQLLAHRGVVFSFPNEYHCIGIFEVSWKHDVTSDTFLVTTLKIWKAVFKRHRHFWYIKRIFIFFFT